MSVDVVTVGVVCADVMARPVEALPRRGSLALVAKLEIHLGGLAGVTAAVLCRLGAKAAFMGRLGQDGFGDYIIGALKSHGVDVSRVRRTAQFVKGGQTVECGTSATIVLIRKDEVWIRKFHRFSLVVWTIWLIPYFSPMFFAMAGS